MSTFAVEMIMLWFALLVGVPALLAGIWRSLKRQRRYQAARGLCRWVSTLWVIAIFVGLIVLGAVAGQGNWSELAVWMTIIVFGIAAAPTLILMLILGTSEFYPDPRREMP